jgi:hypothetical protein
MLTNQEITRKISGIRTSAKAIRNNVHEVLCNVAGHVFDHKNVTQFTRLYEATSGLNRKRIVAWIHANGFARLQKDGTFQLNKSALEKADFACGDDVVEYLTNEVPAWYVDEENAAQILKALDVDASIVALLKKMDNDEREVKVSANVIDLIDQLKAKCVERAA